jgi:hypothetical protein
MFFVERGQYGWSVRAGIEQLGLFLTQRQALQDVRKRRAELTSQDQHSTLVVTGNELEGATLTSLPAISRSALRSRARSSTRKTSSASSSSTSTQAHEIAVELGCGVVIHPPAVGTLRAFKPCSEVRAQALPRPQQGHRPRDRAPDRDAGRVL